MPITYSIGAAAEATGLSVHTIRAWERRYGAPVPARSGTNRRVYSENEVMRLKRLHEAVNAGHSIGLIANLTEAELESLVMTAEPGARFMGDSFIEQAWLAAMELDAARLEQQLQKARSVLGADRFVDELAVPLIVRIDQGWASVKVSIAQEHLASAHLRSALLQTGEAARPAAGHPTIVATTPAGQLHELGALVASVYACRLGWSCTYLGPNLPADEIADAAQRLQARAIALSVVYPEADPRMRAEFRQLRERLGERFLVLVGGRGVPAYASLIYEFGFTVATSREALAAALSAENPGSATTRT